MTVNFIESIFVFPKTSYQGKSLVCELVGDYSAKLSYKGRIVYVVDKNTGIGIVHRARTHYGD